MSRSLLCVAAIPAVIDHLAGTTGEDTGGFARVLGNNFAKDVVHAGSSLEEEGLVGLQFSSGDVNSQVEWRNISVGVRSLFNSSELLSEPHKGFIV